MTVVTIATIASVLLSGAALLSAAEPQESPSCKLNALTAEEQTRSELLRRELHAAVLERVELSDGFAFRYGPEISLARLGEWISLEKRCCSFFRF